MVLTRVLYLDVQQKPGEDLYIQTKLYICSGSGKLQPVATQQTPGGWQL